ncbi:hypothetical protein S2E19_00326 [Bacillus mycoides]|nr:hypothetical protein BTJ44_00901 [Bacillus mycoides]OSY11096.1 hypothetical protein S2E19_00326 [Bacillus mycoides]OSY15870.1 hypothetical protein BTJ48_02726 [Bacillus mycoides]
MSLTLVFFLVLFILFLSTYIGFFIWKHYKIIKYIWIYERSYHFL